MDSTLIYKTIFFLVFLCIVLFGSKHKIIGVRRRKKHLRGSLLVSNKEFVQMIAGDGLAIPNDTSQEKISHLQIRKEDESKHLLICGDTGTGKSALFHSFLHQIRLRPKEMAVVYDPKLEFYKHHGRPERGDILLYPFSNECPYWDLSAEITRPEIAKIIAESLLPCKPGDENDFFVSSSRDVLDKLLIKLGEMHGTVDEFLSWLRDPDMIDALLENEIEANYIPKDAFPQRAGVIGSLTKMGKSLELLPSVEDRRPHFSLSRWVKERPGWIFIGGTGPADQQILQPLFSIWFNILIQQLLDFSEGDSPPASWIFIDEIASLKSLSFLEQAASQARGFNTRLVLGFQNKYQIENFYDKLAQPILSAPKTKIFLRTTEIDSAEWCAKMIGEPEFEQRILSKSFQRSFNSNESVSYREERKTEYLILPSEFSMLADRTGFLQYQGVTTPIAFEYPNLMQRNKVKREQRKGISQSIKKAF